MTAAVCKVLPKIRCDYPRDGAGQLVTHKLSETEFRDYHGLLGHYHVQTDKVDPGPAFQWDYVITGARRLLGANGMNAAEGNARMREVWRSAR